MWENIVLFRSETLVLDLRLSVICSARDDRCTHVCVYVMVHDDEAGHDHGYIQSIIKCNLLS